MIRPAYYNFRRLRRRPLSDLELQFVRDGSVNPGVIFRGARHWLAAPHPPTSRGSTQTDGLSSPQVLGPFLWFGEADGGMVVGEGSPAKWRLKVTAN
jgi:hypothetical protein